MAFDKGRSLPQPAAALGLQLLLQVLLPTLLPTPASGDRGIGGGSLSDNAARLLDEIHGVMSDFGSLDGLFGSANCDFRCPNGGDPHQNATYRSRFQGCAMDEKEVDLSGIPGMAECCDDHNRCYGTCRSNKATCDSDLESCWKLACDDLGKASPEAQQACAGTASVYVASLRLVGCRPFTTAQSEACVCPPEIGRAAAKPDEL